MLYLISWQNSSLPNPLDLLLVAAQTVFPLDYILYTGIVLFLLAAALAGDYRTTNLSTNLPNVSQECGSWVSGCAACLCTGSEPGAPRPAASFSLSSVSCW